VLGRNNRIARSGDPVTQPGLVDENCNKYLAQTVGTLVKKRSLATSNVDCAIARVSGGMVRTDGAILGNRQSERKIPQTLEGYPVITKVTGEIRALDSR
jgi:hypothetical protein